MGASRALAQLLLCSTLVFGTSSVVNLTEVPNGTQSGGSASDITPEAVENWGLPDVTATVGMMFRYNLAGKDDVTKASTQYEVGNNRLLMSITSSELF